MSPQWHRRDSTVRILWIEQNAFTVLRPTGRIKQKKGKGESKRLTNRERKNGLSCEGKGERQYLCDEIQQQAAGPSLRKRRKGGREKKTFTVASSLVGGKLQATGSSDVMTWPFSTIEILFNRKGKKGASEKRRINLSFLREGRKESRTFEKNEPTRCIDSLSQKSMPKQMKRSISHFARRKKEGGA